jgi:hypothetical protein
MEFTGKGIGRSIPSLLIRFGLEELEKSVDTLEELVAHKWGIFKSRVERMVEGRPDRCRR